VFTNFEDSGMDEWRVILETPAGGREFWGVCLHGAQEGRHCYAKWREEKRQAELPRGYEDGMTGFLDATAAWHGQLHTV
jgi:hypothetical protein